MPGHAGHVFALGAEQGHQVVDRVDFVLFDNLVEPLCVERVEFFRDRAAAQLFDEFVFQICGNYIIFAIDMLEIGDEFRSDLSAGSDYKNPFHTIYQVLLSICPQI